MEKVPLTQGKQRAVDFMGLVTGTDMSRVASRTVTIEEAMALGWQRKAEKHKSKYNNVRTEYKGRMYASKKEAAYAAQLDAMKKAKGADRVKQWWPQVRFDIKVKGVKICAYIPDFKVLYADGRIEYVDVKGVKTEAYKIKKKLMKAVHGISIVDEV